MNKRCPAQRCIPAAGEPRLHTTKSPYWIRRICLKRRDDGRGADDESFIDARAGMIRRYPGEATPFFALMAWNVYAGNSYHTCPFTVVQGQVRREEKLERMQLVLSVLHLSGWAVQDF